MDHIPSAEKAHVGLPSYSPTGSVALEPGTDVVLPELEPGVQRNVDLMSSTRVVPCDVVLYG